MPTVTFVAAANPVKYMGAGAAFVRCDDILDTDKIEELLENGCDFIEGKLINRKSRRQIKAVTAVHMLGNPANMEKLMEIKERYNLKVVEDSTEGFGSCYLDGKCKDEHCGAIGDIGVYFYDANKIITTSCGAMAASNSQELLGKVAFLVVQAKTDQLYLIHDDIGYNYRMIDIHAAFGTDQIDRLESLIETKIRNYKPIQRNHRGIEGLTLLPFRDDIRTTHWFYSVIVDRDELPKKLNDENTQTRPLWSLIHRQSPILTTQITE